jgi:hypothetical protein
MHPLYIFTVNFLFSLFVPLVSGEHRNFCRTGWGCTLPLVLCPWYHQSFLVAVKPFCSSIPGLSSDVDVFHAPKLYGDSRAAESYVMHLFFLCMRSYSVHSDLLHCRFFVASCSGFFYLMYWTSSMFCTIF